MFSLLTEPQPRLLASILISSRYNRTCRVWQTCSQFWQLCRSGSWGIANGHERPEASEESSLDVVRPTLGVPWHIVDVRKSDQRSCLVCFLFPSSLSETQDCYRNCACNGKAVASDLWPYLLETISVGEKEISHLYFPFLHSARKKKLSSFGCFRSKQLVNRVLY